MTNEEHTITYVFMKHCGTTRRTVYHLILDSNRSFTQILLYYSKRKYVLVTTTGVLCLSLRAFFLFRLLGMHSPINKTTIDMTAISTNAKYWLIGNRAVVFFLCAFLIFFIDHVKAFPKTTAPMELKQ